MVNVILSAEFDFDDETQLPSLLAAVHEAIADRNDDVSPMLGLEVDGEHRDPDDPMTSLWS